MRTLLVVVCCFVAIVVWWMNYNVFGTSSFDSKVWFAHQTDKSDVTCYRGGMAEDIRESMLNPKMTHKDIENILGTPDGGATKKEYRYILGMCSGIGMDYDDLHIYFDQTGHYEKSAIIQH